MLTIFFVKEAQFIIVVAAVIIVVAAAIGVVTNGYCDGRHRPTCTPVCLLGFILTAHLLNAGVAVPPHSTSRQLDVLEASYCEPKSAKAKVSETSLRTVYLDKYSVTDYVTFLDKRRWSWCETSVCGKYYSEADLVAGGAKSTLKLLLTNYSKQAHCW